MRRPAWINFEIRPTGTRSLVARIARKLVPRSVANAFCQRVVFDHACDAQVFKDNDAELVVQAVAEFVREVLPAVRNPFADMCNHRAPFGAFGRPLLGFRQAALCFGQCSLVFLF